MNFCFKWKHRDGSTVEFNSGIWTSDDPHKLDMLSKMNEYSMSGAIAPAVRTWLQQECELLEFSGPTV
jgi:hypothetical protein